MKYIENNGHVTREYEVKINTSELERIISELKNKCYLVVKNKLIVLANNENDAIEKINGINKEGIESNKILNIINRNQSLASPLDNFFVYECECLCKKNPRLVYALESLLFNYHSSLDYIKDNNQLIDFLIRYSGSDELKPFNERIEIYENEVLKFNNNDNQYYNLKYQKEVEEKLVNTIVEKEYNQNYDFALLNKLYEESKDCFELELVSETVHYKDKGIKVYKLGAKKPL